MARINKIIIIFALAFNFFLPVIFAQNQLNDNFKQMSQDLKDRQRELKEFETESKRSFEQMRQEQKNQRIIQESNRLLNRPEPKQSDKKLQPDNQLSNFLKDNIFQILLIIFSAILLLVAFRLITREEKLLRQAGTVLEDEVIVRVNSWIFEKSSFKDYQGVLGFLISPQVMNINSREFKSSFLEDLTTTEILCQLALEKKIGEGRETKESLLNFEEYLAKIDIQDPQIQKSISNYSLRLSQERKPYVYYYKDFLNILLLLGSRVQSKSFEVFSRSVLVKKLIEEIALDPQVGADPAKTQAKLDLLVKDYVLRFRVVINAGLLG
ncbi:MAG: hypothetical protein PHY94_08230 [Candidatus Omnitrophica bacterium]|nr:hypothetical protein [Candidatus Omnitrophota bacterium]